MSSLLQFGIDGSDRISEKIPPCIKLLTKGPIAALNAAVILRSFGRKHIKVNSKFDAGFLEMQHKFRPAIDLNGDHLKGRVFNEIIEETLGRQARGA